MSERTTIGGVAYETVGSSSSNLLLKCNGTARIQWGSKLIDLIKDGKIAAGSSESKECVFVIDDVSQINSDGVYVLKTDAGSQLWVCKNGKHYNLSGTELYISASNKQDITVEQKQQAIKNLGLCYDTLEEAKNAGIQNGLVYITDESNLYTVKNGIFEEFQAKITSITVEQEQEKEQEIGNVINGSIQIVLSVSDVEYLVLSNQRILSNYPIYIKNSAKISSENASDTYGYRLYMDKTEAHIDSDIVTSRHRIVTPKIESSNSDNTTGFQLYTEGDASYLNVDHINARKWSPFSKGMIMMFDGKADIPEGWAICDGRTYTYEGIETTTPNLVGRFIKAVTDITQVGVINQEHLTDKNDFTLTSEYLPEHSHPHKPHTHTISEIDGTIKESGNLSANLDSSNYACDISEQFIDVVSSVSYSDQEMSTTTASVVSGINRDTQGGTTTGGNHNHSLIITGGDISETQSVEDIIPWENKTIKIEPNAYALIFIIKL